MNIIIIYHSPTFLVRNLSTYFEKLLEKLLKNQEEMKEKINYLVEKLTVEAENTIFQCEDSRLTETDLSESTGKKNG